MPLLGILSGFLLAISCTDCSHFFKQVAKLCEVKGIQRAESSHVYHTDLKPTGFPISTVALTHTYRLSTCRHVSRSPPVVSFQQKASRRHR